MITEVTNNIKYVGCDDNDIDLFESQYPVPGGMCYNSYVIIDEHIAIMDTVDARCQEEWLGKLAQALDGRQPEFLIVQHMEPDHTGCVKAALEQYPSLKIVCSAMAAKFLPQFNEQVDFSGNIQVIKEGDTLALGKHTLQFVGAPFIHWPEVMMTYCVEEQLFFSADAFGKFGTYDADADNWLDEARRYYFNVCGKYGPQVIKLLEKATKLPGIKTVCPLHGPVLEGEKLAEAMRLYGIWGSYAVESQGVLIAYASIHGGTRKAAEKMCDLLKSKNCPKVVLVDLTRQDVAECIGWAFQYGTLLCCASSYDADLFPPMHIFLHKLKLKGYQNRCIALLENGTWSPSAAKQMKVLIEPMKNITLLEPVVTIKSTMHKTDIAQMEALANAILAQ